MLEIVLIVLAGLLLGVVVLAVVGLLRLRAVRARHRRRIAAVQPEHSEPASLVGVASEGKAPGVGTLVLGATHLAFVQLVPEREILVPRADITSTRATRHFLGRTAERDLLLVTWDTDGLSDAVALATTDVDAWRERLT
jgi:hypothetical protein